jgi:mRNA interferase MazF
VVKPRILLQKGDIVTVPFPFSDDPAQSKLRPAVVLWANIHQRLVVLCFISSQNTERLDAGEVILDLNNSEFERTGLVKVSKIKVMKITTLDYALVRKKLGKLGSTHLQELDSVLIKELQLKTEA